MMVEMAREARKDDALYPAVTLGVRLKARFEDWMPELPVASMWSDLLSHALGMVGWIEIARTFLDDHPEGE